MFTKEEIKRNALGCFETILFMPRGAKLFGNSYDEALRSFLIPAILFPVTILIVYFYPGPELQAVSKNTISLLFSLRLVLPWAIFFGVMHWILGRIERMEHFYRFVTATNWLALPATILLMPILWLLFSGAYTWDEIYPFMMVIVFYSYAFTAYMAVHALIIPWEMAAFITIISMMVNDHTTDVVKWIGSVLGA